MHKCRPGTGARIVGFHIDRKRPQIVNGGSEVVPSVGDDVSDNRLTHEHLTKLQHAVHAFGDDDKLIQMIEENILPIASQRGASFEGVRARCLATPYIRNSVPVCTHAHVSADGRSGTEASCTTTDVRAARICRANPCSIGARARC